MPAVSPSSVQVVASTISWPKVAKSEVVLYQRSHSIPSEGPVQLREAVFSVTSVTLRFVGAEQVTFVVMKLISSLQPLVPSLPQSLCTWKMYWVSGFRPVRWVLSLVVVTVCHSPGA